MKLPRRNFLHFAAGAAAMLPASRFGWAQAYPTRPVRVIVPFAPSGPTDVFARIIAQQLSENFGKQFIVQNIAGAVGNIGTGQAARSAHDGYTILITVNSYVVNPILYNKIPYDPFRDFDPVTLAADAPVGFWINPSVPAKSLRDLVALIRANPGKFSYASGGVGGSGHLLAEQFRLSQGLDLVHVPFGGGGPAIASTVAGHIPIASTQLAPAVPHITAGKLRALAITKHSQFFPDVPTMGEAGYPDIDGTDWVGVLVPAGTPKEIINLLNRTFDMIMARPNTTERLAILGFAPVASTPEEFGARIRVEIELWAKVIRAANIKAE